MTKQKFVLVPILINGNPAHKFFDNSTVGASITDVDSDLKYNLSITLELISSDKKIDLTS